MPKPITEQKAKKQLAKMLQSFTTGSILHLLADIHADQTEESTSEKSQQLQVIQMPYSSLEQELMLYFPHDCPSRKGPG